MKSLVGQFWHFLLLAVLLAGTYFILIVDPDCLIGSLWGLSTEFWFLIALASPIVHQIYVLVIWRLELYHNSISRLAPKNGFLMYKIGFAILILSRPVTITLLAIASQNTVEIPPMFAHPVIFIFVLLSIYLFYSVKKYFGMDRAFGIDHFKPQEAKDLPMVNEGIFKYSSNSMYVFGFLVLWVPGLLFLSKAALLMALFNHLYIWVHYYFTEKPDMEAIYGS